MSNDSQTSVELRSSTTPAVEFGLARRYALASLPVLTALMLFMGWWVNRAIEFQVIDNSATNVALYVQSFLAPELQGLADHDQLSSEAIQRLESLIAETPLGQKIRSVKVWKEGGLIAYHSQKALIGSRYEPTANLQRAWGGHVAAEFDELVHTEDQEEAKMGVALLEVYSPIRQNGRDKIIAVAEFYQDAEELAGKLSDTRNRTWLIVAISTLTAYALLYGIVLRGDRLIRGQRRELQGQVTQLSALLEENQHLGDGLKRAVRRTAELNEKLLRRVSADLHDGPAQYIGLASLRLDTLLTDQDGEVSAQTLRTVNELKDILNESLTELRHISRGLALPDLENLNLAETIEKAVVSHQQRTSSSVALNIKGAETVSAPSMLLKQTVYRTIQEALNNAFRHAEGKGQCVDATLGEKLLRLVISDRGEGFSVDALGDMADRLGVYGLRERIESLGGDFNLSSEPGRGTRIEAILPLGVAL